MLEALTVKQADELLADLLPTYGPVRAIFRFAGGSTTGAYRVEFEDAASAPVVLKTYEPATLWWGIKEAQSLGFLADHGITVAPRLLAFSEAADAIGGRACVISALLPGRVLSELDRELTPDQRHEVYRQLGEVLARLHAVPAAGYGYVYGEIRHPVPDNSTHMTGIFEDELKKFHENNAADPALADKIAAYVADRASAFAECPRPAYCHGDVHEENLLAEVADDGTCTLTGLLDPQNMHAGDPLMDFVRLNSFSMHDDATKIAGLLAGYGIDEPGNRPGEWPEAWRSRLALYRISLALELYNWFTITGAHAHLPGLSRELRELVD